MSTLFPNRLEDQFADQASWQRWEKEAKDWNEKVLEEMKKLDEADALWFSVLDNVPEPRIKFYKPYNHKDPHDKLYREHDLRLRRLGEMLQTNWREVK